MGKGVIHGNNQIKRLFSRTSGKKRYTWEQSDRKIIKTNSMGKYPLRLEAWNVRIKVTNWKTAIAVFRFKLQ